MSKPIREIVGRSENIQSKEILSTRIPERGVSRGYMFVEERTHDTIKRSKILKLKTVSNFKKRKLCRHKNNKQKFDTQTKTLNYDVKDSKLNIHQNSLLTFRRKWGLTQQQVAEQMQLSRSMIAMIEQGRRTVPTNILLQLAQLEIKIADRNNNEEIKSICPDANAISEMYQRHCEQLALKESYCEVKADELTVKLNNMIALFEKTSEWLQVILLHIKNAGDNKNVLSIWKKHELSARRTLNNCNLPSQLLLKNTIISLNEEADLHKNMQLQIKKELAAITLQINQQQ